ncbi:MAG: hypothetical protein ABSA21_01635 [Candidatus Limnocylindrales bacterium]|jgi:hypothetical protein
MFRRRDRSSPEAADRPRDGAEPDADEGPEAEDAAADAAEQPAPEDVDVDLDSQAADYLADNDAWLYGPNAVAVLAVLDRLEEVGPDDAATIAEEWRSAPRSDRDAARKAARKLTEADAEMARHVQMAREEIGAWLSVAAEYPEYAKAVPNWARICSQVSDAALDAVTATILEDELEEPDYQALFLPWTEALEKVMVEHELEEIEGGAGAVDAQAGEGDAEAEAETEKETEGEFGPNTDSVADFLNRLWLLSPEQVARLVSAWQEAPHDALELAHQALHGLVEEDPNWHDQVRRAQEQIVPWLNGGRLQETAGFMGQTGQSVTRRMAGPALADAIAALVVGDLLAPKDAEALYAPWFNLVGAPPLPEPADEEGRPAGSDRAEN